MATPLTNDRWGYDSNCFVCEAGNAGGMRLPFQLDDDGCTVSCSFQLDSTYSGAPALVHGGVTLAILDEAQAWACIAVAGKWGLTASTSAEFTAPVFIDQLHLAEAEVTEVGDGLVRTVGRVADAAGAVLVSSSSVFHVVGDVDLTTGEGRLDDRQRRLLGER